MPLLIHCQPNSGEICASVALVCRRARLTGTARHGMPVTTVLLHGIGLTLLGGRAERSIGMGLHSTVKVDPFRAQVPGSSGPSSMDIAVSIA